MKAGGFYDAHSEYQRRVVEAGAKAIKQMVAALDLGGAKKVCTIADYGCGTGATTAHAVGIAARAVRERNATCAIQTIHADQMTNDFNQVLRTATESYLRDVSGPLFVGAVGGSFFEQLVPAASVELGMCSNAAHWFRREPEVELPDGMYFSAAHGESRMQLARAAAEDWLAFLAARGVEIVSGGRMLVQGIATILDAQNREEVSAEALLTLMWEIAGEMADAGMIERSRLVSYIFPVYCRSEKEAIAPMQPGGLLENIFAVEALETSEVPNPYWELFEQNEDARAYAQSYRAFVRAFAESALREHLFNKAGGSAEEICAEFFKRLEAAIADNPLRGRYRAWVLRLTLARR